MEQYRKTTIFDVANYILWQEDRTPSFKLHKLLYLCLAESLVLGDEPLFTERVDAWIGGPAFPALYETHNGNSKYVLTTDDLPKSTKELNEEEIKVVGAVLTEWYDVDSIGDIINQHEPFVKARIGLAAGERGSNEITYESIRDYYRWVRFERPILACGCACRCR